MLLFENDIYMPVYINFIVCLIQMFKSMKWLNKYFLIAILILVFFPELKISPSKKKFINCEAYVSNLL